MGITSGLLGHNVIVLKTFDMIGLNLEQEKLIGLDNKAGQTDRIGQQNWRNWSDWTTKLEILIRLENETAVQM